MNKIFKVIWNPATGSYSVASETAKSRGKKSGRSKLLISALVAGGLLSSSGALAQAGLDTGTGVTPAGHNNGTGWIAIGTDAEASTHTTTNGAATAVGYYSKALGMWSTALGAYSESNGNASLALGVKAQSNGDRSISMGASSSASINAGYSIAMGVFAFTDAEYAVALGNESKALGKYSLALGNASQASGESSIALGNTSEASEQNAIALGQGSIASKVNSIALGSNSSSAGENAIALGEGSAAGGSNSLAFGSQSRASGNDSVALGVGATAATDNSVAIGAGSTTDASNTVSVGNSTTKRKIVNMAAGAISNTSTDAINGSQLYTISDSVAKRLGGGATVGNDGSISAVSYALKSGTYNNVGDALSGIDNNTLQWNRTAGAFTAAHGSNTTSKITNVAKGTVSATSTDVVNGSQLYDLQQDALLWNGTAFSAAHGTNATNKITNVTAGELSDTSTDAVNGSQLKATKDDVAANTTNITNLTGEVAGNTTSITNLTDTVTNLGEDALKWDDASGAFTAAHGTNATNKITNVTAGELSDTSTDAVNGSQLKTTNDNVATNTTNIATNTTNITNLTDTVNNLGEDALKWDDAAGAFTAAHGTNATNKISNVQAGIVSSDSTDAINGSQLYGLADSFTSYLGGGADISDTGVLTGPTYSIGGTDYTNVGDALAAINTSFSDSLGDALLWDATANDGAGAFSAGRGVDNTASKITNVANGAISATSSDAINGSQLYTTNKYIADALGGDAEVNADGTITAPTYTIANTDYNNVGEALDALDENALLWDATANNGEGAYNASHDGKASIITNVADGNIGEGSTDAINGSQLFNTNMLIQQNSEVINQLAGNTSETYIEENGAGINYVRTNDTGLTFTDASAAGIGSTAVGYNTVAKGDSSVAIGQGSYSGVETSIALGSESVSSRVIVKGSRNTSVSEEGVVIGYDTTDGELLGALSIGDDGKYRQIINVADGSEAHDAVTVRQLQNAIGAVATTPTKYYHANSTAEDSLAVGEDSLAMGAKTIVNGNAGIGIGLNTLVLADAINGIAIGSNASANHANSIAMGNGSQTTRGAQTNYTAYNMDAPQNSVGEFSVGSEDGQRQITNVAAGSADTDAVNVGQLKVTDAQVSQNTQSITNLNNQVTNLDTRVTNIENGIGDIVTTGSTKYFKTNTDGVDANAQGKDSVAIGSGSIAAADNSVALGTGSVANEENTISVGSSTNQRRITNVAAGVNATDAVNVSQLKSSEAGGVRYDTKADGSVDYSNITLGGGNGGTTRISNVSAGVNNNDAVNYAQLKQSVQETKQYTDQRMVEMDNKLSKTESKLSGGIASAMAMTGLPQAYTPGASMASIGGGTYNGESAVALGVSMVSANGRWVYKLQGSTNSQGEYSAALGAGIQW
ncbi:TPA: YadA-like family protein [Escherichia coli]|uniref:YadA-like family protein n=1 Tax=Escherichia coli TaxID=562 RepID=UPI0010C267BE|nr:YadA-like family protein [Escherichia coli]EIH7459446.1 YadA-like family protein [Escherichia coli]MDS0916475.1 YadA-like family protein [Escherichia coli]GCT00647.1 autotransport adhesin [Escherichia coli]HBB9932876.1 YadA-like family protein [Escherichia coli]HBH8904738.1 YadA-like family protein [Escherichia coli]